MSESGDDEGVYPRPTSQPLNRLLLNQMYSSKLHNQS